ncbi:MAG: NTP transferase domain-containing protein [Thermodesulfobacteriota bacterium]
MQAVILAAGFGSRLNRLSKGLPKCLIPVGGRPIIEHQIEALSDAGVGRVLVVVGHKADEVRKTLGSRVEYIENTRYDKTNSLYSLWLARDWVKEPFVLLNCDLVFQPEILDRVLTMGGNVLAYDSTSTKGQEQTKVAVQNGMVVDLGKDLPPESARGESLGLLRFDSGGTHALFSRVHALIEKGEENSWVIEGIRSVCREIGLKAYNAAGMPWVEVDFPNDLERARKEVWPAIEKTRWKRTIHWRKTKYLAMGFVAAALLSTGLLVGSYSSTENITWTTEAASGGEKVSLHLTKGRQKWWESSKGKPLKVTLEGPLKVRAHARLLMPPGTNEPGRYVVEISVDGKPFTWRSFKATPDADAFLEDFVVGDSDRVSFEIHEGTHIVEVGLLAGTSDKFLGRVSYPEPLSAEDDQTEE